MFEVQEALDAQKEGERLPIADSLLHAVRPAACRPDRSWNQLLLVSCRLTTLFPRDLPRVLQSSSGGRRPSSDGRRC